MNRFVSLLDRFAEQEKQTILGLCSDIFDVLHTREHEVSAKEYAIYMSMPKQVSRRSFVRFCDENNISLKLAKNYSLVAQGGRGLDQIAQSASFHVGSGDNRDAVTVEDVVAFMNEAYPGGTREFVRKNCTAKIRPLIEQLRNYNIYFYAYKTSIKKTLLAHQRSETAPIEDDHDCPF